MAQKVTGQFGNENISLTNAATEATLERLFNVTKDMAKAKGIETSQVERKFKELSKSTDDVVDSFEELEEEADSLGSKLAGLGMGALKLVNAIGGAAGSAVAFSASVASTPMSMRKFTDDLEHSSLNILGLGTAINAITNLLYTQLDTFRSMSNSGILLSAEFDRLNMFAADLGIGTEELGTLFANNAENLTFLGGATTGARKTIEGLTATIGNFDRDFLQYGLTYQEFVESQLKFFVLNERALKNGTQSYEEVGKRGVDVAKAMRILSDATGEQADTLMEKLNNQRLESAFDSYLQTIDDPDRRDRLRIALAQQEQAFGEAGKFGAMARILGAPIPEAARNLQVLSNAFRESQSGALDLATNFNGGSKEFTEALVKNQSDIANANREEMERVSRFGATIGLFGSEYGEAFNIQANFIKQFSTDVNKTREIIKGLADDTTGGSLITLESALKDFRQFFVDLFVGSDGTGGLLNNQSFKGGVKNFADFMKEFASQDLPQLMKNFDPFTEDGRTRLFDKFAELFDSMMYYILSLLNDAGVIGDYVIPDRLVDKFGRDIQDRKEFGSAAGASVAKREVISQALTDLLTTGTKRQLSEDMNPRLQELYETTFNQMMGIRGDIMSNRASQIIGGRINDPSTYSGGIFTKLEDVLKEQGVSDEVIDNVFKNIPTVTKQGPLGTRPRTDIDANALLDKMQELVTISKKQEQHIREMKNANQ